MQRHAARHLARTPFARRNAFLNTRCYSQPSNKNSGNGPTTDAPLSVPDEANAGRPSWIFASSSFLRVVLVPGGLTYNLRSPLHHHGTNLVTVNAQLALCTRSFYMTLERRNMSSCRCVFAQSCLHIEKGTYMGFQPASQMATASKRSVLHSEPC